MREEYFVSSYITDLRKHPIERTSSILERDQNQESQCLFQETLLLLEEKGDWALVEAVEQAHFDSSWKGYLGWVKKADIQEVQFSQKPNYIVDHTGVTVQDHKGEELLIPIGTQLYAEDLVDKGYKIYLKDGSIVSTRYSLRPLSGYCEKEVVDRALVFAQSLLGAPYFWGGRGAFHGTTPIPTSVDCSSLVNLAYRLSGIDLPRNAHDQFLKCKKINNDQLQKGDLVYFARKSAPFRIHHVMIYDGSRDLLEATGDSDSVRRISLSERLNSSEDEICYSRPFPLD